MTRRDGNEMSFENIAILCHEVNRAYCVSLGDNSQKPWNEAEEWQKESARKGVLFVSQNPDAPVSATHDSWLEEKRRDGWKYRPVKDAEKKEHPCFVDYEELSKEQQAKDCIFNAIVNTCLGRSFNDG